MAITKRIDGAYTISATGGIALSNAVITAGTGITSVATAIVKHSVITLGNIIETTIILDLTGLNSGDADGDIIGKAGTANCHYGQITTAINGTILSGYIQCLETPAGGESDIDLYSATEATGTEESLITALTETALLNTDGDWVGKHLSTKLNTLASNGTIKAEHIVNAGGLWAREIGRMVGLELFLLLMGICILLLVAVLLTQHILLVNF